MLFVYSIPMFLAVTTRIQIRHLRKGGHLLPPKEKPTDLGIPLGAFCLRAHNTQEAHRDLTCLLVVEVMPETHLHRLLVFVVARPEGVGFSLCGRLLAGEARSIQARPALLAGSWRCRAIQNPVLGQACQQVAG